MEPTIGQHMIRDKTVICHSLTDWDAPQIVSRQQIMKRLAKHNRVLFVEPPRALHSLVTDRRKSLIQWKRWMGGALRKGPGRMMVASPPPVFPFFYHPLTNALNQRILTSFIKKCLKKLGWEAQINWTYWPNSAEQIGRYGEETSVYHCTDNIIVAKYPFTSREIISNMEETLARKVDLVITRTQGLADRLASASKRIEVIGGGVDTGLFDPARHHDCPHAMAAIPAPRVGMVATMDDRLNLPLIELLADTLPDVSFVFVGHVRKHLVDLSSVSSRPNVHFLPAVQHEQVPACIQHLDLCLIPFLVNEYTREVAPTKLYECLSMGKRIVSTRLPYIEREQAVVTIVDTAEEALHAVQDALGHAPESEENERLRKAALPWSWEQQVRHIEQLLEGAVA